MRVNVTFRRFRVTVVTVEISVTYSGCVSVAFFIHHAMPMSHIVWLSVTCPTLPYLSALSHIIYVFGEKDY